MVRRDGTMARERLDRDEIVDGLPRPAGQLAQRVN
jgi:hypothetical protein